MCRRHVCLLGMFVAVMLLLGGLAACQKVELPSEEEVRLDSEKEDTDGGQSATDEGEDETVDIGDGGELFDDEDFLGVPCFDVNDFILCAEEYDQNICVVKGYIVGYTTRSMKNAVFSATDAVRTNILIASESGECDAARCIPVELAEEEYRKSLSLFDHPENLGRQVAIMGIARTYFYVPGLRDLQIFKWMDGKEPADPGLTEEPEDEVNPSEEPEEETVRKDTLKLDPSGDVITGGRVVNPKK